MANSEEIKGLDIIWYVIFVLGFNGYMNNFEQLIFIIILLGLFIAMDFFFSGSKLLTGVKIATILAILYRSGDYGSFLNPLWLYNMVTQVNSEIQFLMIGNLDRMESLPMVGNLFFFLIFKELILKNKLGTRFDLIVTFAGGSFLMYLSMLQGTGFSVIVIGFMFFGIVKMIFTNMLKSKLTFDLDKFTFNLLISILLIIILIWVSSSPITLAKELETFRNRIQGGLTNIGGDSGGVTRIIGYNSNDLVLGGPLQLSERPVLRMITDVPVYLRGESKFIYTGAGWTEDIVSRTSVAADDIPVKRYPGVEYEEVTIQIEVLNGNFSVLFSPLRTQAVNIRRGSWIILANESDLFINYQVGPGDKYEIVFLNPLFTEDFLRRNVSMREDFPLEEYTSLPSNFPQSIVELATRLTDGLNNNYDKAVAIQNYLRSREFSYSLDVDFPPRGMDFVEHFLQVRKGYCVHFATAFVVMARSVGIPARWVKGFTSGVRVNENEHIISDKHAHAWGEVYLPQAGWVTFEPTPGFQHRQYMDRSNNGDTNSPADPSNNPLDPDGDTPLEDAQGNVERGNERDVSGSIVNYQRVGFFLILSLMVGLIAFLYNKSKFKQLPPRKKIILLYNNTILKFKLLGLGRKVNETPHEYAQRLAQHKKIHLNPLLSLTGAFESVYYGNNNLEEVEYLELHKVKRKYNYVSLILKK